MSLRNLTTQLQQETSEHTRSQKFQSARVVSAPAKTENANKQTPFMVGLGTRKENGQAAETPALPIQQETQAPKIGLKERAASTTYGIPGGIAARFGREALKAPVAPPQPTKEEPEETTPEPVPKDPIEEVVEAKAEDAETEAQEKEREAEPEDDAARITIELQSH